MSNHSQMKTLTALLLTSTIILTSSNTSYSAIEDTNFHGVPETNINIPFSSITATSSNPTELLLASSGVGVNTGTTNAVVGVLGGATSECRSAGDTYAVSCLSRAFKKAAARAENPDYYDARRELRRAAKQLDKLVAANADKKAPKKRGKYGSYKAVKKENVAAVKRAALKIVQETETKLIRSSGDGLRKIHYKRIAQAVGSTKVLLRT